MAANQSAQMTGQMTVTPADKTLAAECYQIHRDVQYLPWSESTFIDCTTSPYTCWALSDDNVIAGYAVILSVLDEATLMDIGISPARQGQGLGRLLLTYVLDALRQSDHRICFLEVRASNSTAFALYERLGFTLLERRKNYYPAAEGREDALIMSLAL